LELQTIEASKFQLHLLWVSKVFKFGVFG